MNLPLHKEAGRYVVADSFGDIAFNAYSLYDLDLCTFWLKMVGYPFKLLLVFMEINVPSCPIPFKQCSNEKHVNPLEIAKEKPWLEEPARSRAVDAVIHNLSNQLPAFVRRRGQVTNLYLVPRGPKVWRFFF